MWWIFLLFQKWVNLFSLSGFCVFVLSLVSNRKIKRSLFKSLWYNFNKHHVKIDSFLNIELFLTMSFFLLDNDIKIRYLEKLGLWKTKINKKYLNNCNLDKTFPYRICWDTQIYYSNGNIVFENYSVISRYYIIVIYCMPIDEFMKKNTAFHLEANL